MATREERASGVLQALADWLPPALLGRAPRPTTLEGWVRLLLDIPLVKPFLIVCNLIGFVAGLIYWYGADFAVTPPQFWPWLPDSPLSAFWFALALLLISLKWENPTVFSIGAVANIKYGLWTDLVWILYWRATGDYNLESIAMSFTHTVMIIQGIVLFILLKPTLTSTVSTVLWYVLGDLIDYGFAFGIPWAYYPRFPEDVVPMAVVLPFSLATTAILLLYVALRYAAARRQAQGAKSAGGSALPR
jgi:uncharacterized membrane protein YpjA